MSGLTEKNSQVLLMGVLYVCFHTTHQAHISEVKSKNKLTCETTASSTENSLPEFKLCPCEIKPPQQIFQLLFVQKKKHTIKPHWSPQPIELYGFYF